MDILVGSTGFVGTNLVKSHTFTEVYHRTDVEEAYGKRPDLLVYAGVPAEMFLANKDPKKDMDIIRAAMRNIEKIKPKRVVLISTIAVYRNPVGVNENTPIETKGLSAYGKNRHELECYVMEHFDNHLIVRLPALFGVGLKKNFIYDMIHRIPSMLTETRFHELAGTDDAINKYYQLLDNGFYKCKEMSADEERILRAYFDKAGFSALNFTDSRSVYQFYNLAHLWEHIVIALQNNIKILNTATEPISAGELFYFVTGKQFENILDSSPYNYNYISNYADLFGGMGGYLFKKSEVIEEVRNFINKEANC